MAFDPTYIPPQMNHWTPEGVMSCVQEIYDEIDFGEKYGAGAVFRMQLDCSVYCLLTVLNDHEEEDKLEIIRKAETEATDMLNENEVPVLGQMLLRQIMADIYDSAEEAVRRWGE